MKQWYSNNRWHAIKLFLAHAKERQEVFINNRNYTIRLLWHRVLSRLNQLMILFDSISSQNRIPEELEMWFCGRKHIPEVLELQFRGQKSIPRVWGKQFRIAKPIPKVVECWRKMRNHSAEMKSLIAKCAACFFFEKSNSRPEIGLFIFEKSNRKLLRILFFWKVQFPNRN